MNSDEYFCVRTYEKEGKLISCDWVNKDMKPFPLVPRAVLSAFPNWDGGGIPSEIEDEILRLEDEENLEYYEDIWEDTYSMHKVGVDSGRFYFFYCKDDQRWEMQCDFY